MDWQKVVLLLDVIHKASMAGPAYNWFASRASLELLQMQPTADKLMVASAEQRRRVPEPVANDGGKGHE